MVSFALGWVATLFVASLLLACGDSSAGNGEGNSTGDARPSQATPTGGTTGTSGIITTVVGPGSGQTDGGTTALSSPSSTGAGGATAPAEGGAGLEIPMEQAAKFQSCQVDADCHIVWLNCGCVAVRTEVASLLDPDVCGTNACAYTKPTAAVCNDGRCELFLDPGCAVDSDCRILWSRCASNAPMVDAGASCACAAVHQTNSKTSALVSAAGDCPGAISPTARAVCRGTGKCALTY